MAVSNISINYMEILQLWYVFNLDYGTQCKKEVTYAIFNKLH